MEILDKNNAQQISEYERFNMLHGNFMQSLRWADVKSNWSREAVVSRNGRGEIRAVCLVLIRKIPLAGTSFMYAPHGPVVDWSDGEAAEDIFNGIKQLAEKYHAYRFMCDPLFGENEQPRILRTLGFAHAENAEKTVQPRANYVLKNIGGNTGDELISRFKPDYRNRVRKAARKGVYCRRCGVEALDDFYPLMRQTGRRDGFLIRSRDYFARLLNSFPGEQCRLFMCYAVIDGREVPLSGAVAVRYGNTGTYVYGASSDQNRNLCANYLMQFEMMKWAVEGGCDTYDLGGIPHYDDENDPAYGLYRFKRGFGGEVAVYAGEFTRDFRPNTARLADICAGIAFVRREHERRKENVKPEKINA